MCGEDTIVTLKKFYLKHLVLEVISKEYILTRKQLNGTPHLVPRSLYFIPNLSIKSAISRIRRIFT
jgi:hypothetical protein